MRTLFASQPFDPDPQAELSQTLDVEAPPQLAPLERWLAASSDGVHVVGAQRTVADLVLHDTLD